MLRTSCNQPQSNRAFALPLSTMWASWSPSSRTLHASGQNVGAFLLCRFLCGWCALSVPPFPTFLPPPDRREMPERSTFELAGELGFEPRLTESESAVLP